MEIIYPCKYIVGISVNKSYGDAYGTVSDTFVNKSPGLIKGDIIDDPRDSNTFT